MSGPIRQAPQNQVDPENNLEDWLNQDLSDIPDTEGDAHASLQGDSFGDHPQNISRDQIMQLFHKVQGDHPHNEKELLNILRDALRDIASHDQESAWEAYSEVEGRVGTVHENPATNTDDSQSDSPENPRPARTEHGVNIFDSMQTSSYVFNVDYSQSIKINDISSNGGQIRINAASTRDTVNVSKTGNGEYQIQVHKNGSRNTNDTITYKISGPPSRILINALPQNIQGVSEDDSIIQAGIGPNSNAILWPTSSGDLTNKVPPGGDGANEARTLLEKITDAINSNTSGKWEEASNYLNGLWPSQSQNHNPPIVGGPALRKALTAIYTYVGNNDNKFKQIMMKLDPHLRSEMSRCLHHFSTGTNVYRIGQSNTTTNPDGTTSTYIERSYGQGTTQNGDAKSNEGFENLLSSVPATQVPNTAATDDNEEDQ